MGFFGELTDESLPIRRKSPLVRDLIFPYHSRAQILVLLGAMIVVALAVSYFVGDGYLVIMPCAYFGGNGVSFATAPGEMTCGSSLRPIVVASLEELKFRPSDGAKKWDAPLPSWMRWSNSGVVISSHGDTTKFEGPLSTLKAVRVRAKTISRRAR